MLRDVRQVIVLNIPIARSVEKLTRLQRNRDILTVTAIIVNGQRIYG